MDPIAELNAALAGRYLIQRKVGAGGMATVYLADDQRHERRVALKVLKAELAAVMGAERFLGEIKTTANLHHPNILPLFDSGEAGGFLFYVMPFVDGETLRDRLDRERQLPVDEGVRIATSVAAALQHAHDRGVIHRDIKPANILLQDGQPIVADFGIALAVGAAGGDRLTQTGVSLGTPYYMSPEQATGDQAVGPRSDTYALACVLYEMLVGEPPFPGATSQVVLGKILRGDPVSTRAARSAVPLHVDAAIRKGLERLPADRFSGAGDFAKALGDAGFRYGDAADGGTPGPGSWKPLAIATSAVAAAAILALAFSLMRDAPNGAGPVVTRQITGFLEGQSPINPNEGIFSLSLDGSTLVYQGGPAPQNQLWVRRWDALEAHPIPGTEGGYLPSVSPDGSEVAFARGEQFHVVSTQGGPVRTLGDGQPRHWGRDGFIYGTSLVEASLGGAFRVAATGGGVEQITELDESELVHIVDDILPGGEQALLTVVDDPDGDGIPDGFVTIAELGTGNMKRLREGQSARYVPSGHMVFQVDSALYAAPFSPNEAEFLGPAVPLVSLVRGFGLSDSGSLFYSVGRSNSNDRTVEPIWVTRSGQETPVDPGWTAEVPLGWASWRLSPDGGRVALVERTAAGRDVWIKELDGGLRSRLTLAETADLAPRWAPDGRSITYVSGSIDDFSLWSISLNGAARPERLVELDVPIFNGTWSPDGEWLVLSVGGGTRSSVDIVGLRPGTDSLPVPLLVGDYAELNPEISPDGRWLAYASYETGKPEVFVRPFPEVEAAKWQVSIDGGLSPRWASSGKELFYVERLELGHMTAVRYNDDPEFEVVGYTREFPLQAHHFFFQMRTGDWDLAYDVTPDGQRFLMARPDAALEDAPGAAPTFVMVSNWLEELKERVPR